MLLNGILGNEGFQFHVELFADPDNNFIFLIRLTEKTYLLAQRSIMTTQWTQMSGSYIEPELLDVIFHTIDLADHVQLKLELKPLHELKRTFFK